MDKTMPNILCLVNSQPFHVLPCRSCSQRCGQSRSRGQKLFASKSNLAWARCARRSVGKELVPLLPHCLWGQRPTGSGRVTLLFTVLGFSKIVSGSRNSPLWVSVGGKGHSSVCLEAACPTALEKSAQVVWFISSSDAFLWFCIGFPYLIHSWCDSTHFQKSFSFQQSFLSLTFLHQWSHIYCPRGL